MEERKNSMCLEHMVIICVMLFTWIVSPFFHSDAEVRSINLRKTKEKINKRFRRLNTWRKKHEYKKFEQKAVNVEKPKDAVAVIKEFDDITKSKNKNLIWLLY